MQLELEGAIDCVFSILGKYENVLLLKLNVDIEQMSVVKSGWRVHFVLQGFLSAPPVPKRDEEFKFPVLPQLFLYYNIEDKEVFAICNDLKLYIPHLPISGSKCVKYCLSSELEIFEYLPRILDNILC